MGHPVEELADYQKNYSSRSVIGLNHHSIMYNFSGIGAHRVQVREAADRRPQPRLADQPHQRGGHERARQGGEGPLRAGQEARQGMMGSIISRVCLI